jgi:phage repressor protein C with HTH and peptisase S24 domain
VIGPAALGATIPVYGHAVGGPEGQFILNGNKISDVIAPASLAGVSGAYAVLMVGESMEPRYHPGETLYVNPRLPIRRGDYVVVQIIGSDEDQPEAYVKKFVNQDAHVLRLEQYNPRKIVEFPRRRVASVHKIILGGEG